MMNVWAVFLRRLALKRRTEAVLVFFLLGWSCWLNPLWAGPLAKKAGAFDRQIQEKNCPNGLVFSIVEDGHGRFRHVAGDGDSCIWIVAYVTAQVNVPSTSSVDFFLW
jgi:hypothetical protein